MDKDRLWKELEASPETAFKELLKACEREGHEKKLQKLGELARERAALWAHMRKEVNKKTLPQKEVVDWINTYGAFQLLTPEDKQIGKAHLWNPNRRDQFSLCSAKTKEKFEFTFDEDKFSKENICSTCASSKALGKNHTPDTLTLGMLWVKLLREYAASTTHLTKGDGTLLCGGEGEGKWRGYCRTCLDNMGGIENLKKEVEIYIKLEKGKDNPEA